MSDPASKDSTETGQIIGDRYKVLKKLGEGGMGEVFMAEHIHIEKRVALKLLRAEVLSNAEAVARFRQEARSASSIGHENIIAIDDFGTLADGRVYMAMEFLSGSALNDLLKEGELPMARALDILIQTGKGLAAAHAKGITHRDMKPENVFVTQRDGRELVKILDFGIAKVSGGSAEVSALTQAGTIFGTPFYMAPEQALSSKMDHRVDVYALGVMCYETFTGSLPFQGETFMGILTQHITTPPIPPSVMAARKGRTVPPELEQVILTAMGKGPEERYQSMNDLVSALTEVYRLLCGPRATGMMAPAPLSPSQFVPVPSQYMNAYQPGMTAGMPAVGSGPMPLAPAPKKGGALFPVMLFALLGLGIGGGAGWYFVFGPGAGASQAVTPPPETPPPPPPEVKVVLPPMPKVEVKPEEPKPEEPKPEVKPEEKPVAIRPEPKKPDPKPEPKPEVKPEPPKTVDVLIDSYPRGAEIYQGGAKVGETPSNVTVTVGTPVTVELRLDGYNDAKLSVDGTEKKVQKKLKKVRSESDPGEIKGWGEVTGEEKEKPEDPDGLE